MQSGSGVYRIFAKRGLPIVALPQHCFATTRGIPSPSHTIPKDSLTDLDINTAYSYRTTSAIMETFNLVSAWRESKAAIFIEVATLCSLILIVISVLSTNPHLESLPGPLLAKYTRLWLLQALRSEQCAQRYLEACKTYGKR